LLDQVHERRGIAYADCSADVTELCGELVVGRRRCPKHLDSFSKVAALLNEHAAATDPVGLARARNQIMVRTLCAQEVPAQRLESAALDLFAFGRVRAREELMAGIAAVSPAEVRGVFARMRDRPGVALAGRLARGVEARVARLLPAPTTSTTPRRAR
jgi:hypothetical protein